MFLQSFLKEQPARKLYPFDRGWRILTYGLQQFLRRSRFIVNWWLDNVQELHNNALSAHWFQRFWLYAWAGVMTLYAFVFCLAMVGVGILSGIFFILSLLVYSLLCVLLICLFNAIPLLNAKMKATFYCCPSCHRSMPVPLYRCSTSTCGKEHTHLVPSLYGIMQHTCNGCGKQLPTLMVLGRDSKLRRYCPHCKRPLNKGIGKGSNIHIPLVGGTLVGKTTYMVTSIDAFKRSLSTMSGTSVSFPDPMHERMFQRNLKELAMGRPLSTTPDRVPYAYNLLFRMRGFLAHQKLLYLYDAQGEMFETMEGLGHQEYYKYTRGILFLIDPFAIPDYCERHREEIKPIHNLLRPATLDIEYTYGRLMEMLDAIEASHHTSSMPIAIVVNKSDACNLEDEIGEPAAQALKKQDPSLSTEGAMSIAVQAFLREYGLVNFVNNVESRFHNVRYFSCSALGRLPSPTDTSSFTPIRVLEPLLWLLTTARFVTKK